MQGNQSPGACYQDSVLINTAAPGNGTIWTPVIWHAACAVGSLVGYVTKPERVVWNFSRKIWSWKFSSAGTTTLGLVEPWLKFQISYKLGEEKQRISSAAPSIATEWSSLSANLKGTHLAAEGGCGDPLPPLLGVTNWPPAHQSPLVDVWVCFCFSNIYEHLEIKGFHSKSGFMVFS